MLQILALIGLFNLKDCLSFTSTFISNADRACLAEITYIPWGIVNFFLFLIISFIIYKYLRYQYLTNKIDRVYQEKKFNYDETLNRYNPYYKSLTATGKDRFLKRVIFFIETKSSGISVWRKMN